MRAQEMFIVCSGKLRENNLSFARQHLNKADTRPHKQRHTETLADVAGCQRLPGWAAAIEKRGLNISKSFNYNLIKIFHLLPVGSGSGSVSGSGWQTRLKGIQSMASANRSLCHAGGSFSLSLCKIDWIYSSERGKCLPVRGHLHYVHASSKFMYILIVANENCCIKMNTIFA